MAAVASPYVIRPMTIADIPQVSAIERESFPTMWPQTAYKRELQQNSIARYLVVGDSSESPPAPEQLAEPRRSGLGRMAEQVRRLLRQDAAPAEAPQSEAIQEYLVGF